MVEVERRLVSEFFAAMQRAIGEGFHERILIDLERFLARLASRL
jgi:hypothetical protein